MMKKIKSIKQLQTEKKRIKLQQAQLEKEINSQWSELKDDLKPVNVAKETVIKLLKSRTDKSLDSESILKTSITYAAGLLTKRLMDKAEKKFDSYFKK